MKHNPQNTTYTNDDIPLRSSKVGFTGSISYTGVDLHEPSPGRYHQVSRPRPAPKHHFWKKPLGLGTVIFIGDALLTAAPCLFLILAFQALTLNGKPISSHGRTIEQAAKLGPTLFPIIFAAVVGRLMRVVALWRAERGAPLGILEQLNGSQNLLAAFERAILLPGLGILSFGVVLLWALSPLGGQSSLRVLTRDEFSTHSNASIFYFNNSGDANGGTFGGASSLSAGGTTLSGIFQSTLLSIERVKGNDLWGNVKIPFLQNMPSYRLDNSRDGWFDFSEDDYTGPYSSLTGNVISLLNTSVDTNFTMESSYFNLSCPEPRFFTIDLDNPNATVSEFYGGFVEWSGDRLIHSNLSQLFAQQDEYSVSWNSYLIDTNWNSSTATPDQKFNVIYASQGGLQTEVAAYNCTMGVTHVESDIICKGDTCHVRRLRPSRNVTWPAPGGGWPFVSEGITLPYNMLSWLSTATSGTHSAEVSPIDWYISGSDTPYSYTFNLETDVSYRNISGLILAQRLGSLINTAYQIGFQAGATAQSPSNNETALALGLNYTTASGGVGYDTTRTTAMTTVTEERFVANMAWVAVTLIVAFILLFCGIVSMVFKYGTSSPDILGFVSSMTRDNPNFEHIPGSDKLDGLERARLLRHLRVQIVDVKPWDENGHVTLRNLGHSRRAEAST